MGLKNTSSDYGALAKASDAASQRGAFFDSTVDRVGELFMLGAIALVAILIGGYGFAVWMSHASGQIASISCARSMRNFSWW